MDPRTAQFYATNAADLARCYIAAGSAPARHFPIAFTPGSRILDIGCGSGRDLQALLDAGYNAIGIDATHEMLGEAKVHYPALAARLTCDTLPNLSSVADTAYDGILCWAVLMHLSVQQHSSSGLRSKRMPALAGPRLVDRKSITRLEGIQNALRRNCRGPKPGHAQIEVAVPAIFYARSFTDREAGADRILNADRRFMIRPEFVWIELTNPGEDYRELNRGKQLDIYGCPATLSNSAFARADKQ